MHTAIIKLQLSGRINRHNTQPSQSSITAIWPIDSLCCSPRRPKLGIARHQCTRRYSARRLQPQKSPLYGVNSINGLI